MVCSVIQLKVIARGMNSINYNTIQRLVVNQRSIRNDFKIIIQNFIQNLLSDSINRKVGNRKVVENQSLTLKSLIESSHDAYEVTIIKTHALQEVTQGTIYTQQQRELILLQTILSMTRKKTTQDHNRLCHETGYC